MSDGMLRKWVRKFNEDRVNEHDEPRSGRPFVVTRGQVLRGEDNRNWYPVMINALIMVETV
jgi:transposase